MRTKELALRNGPKLSRVSNCLIDHQAELKNQINSPNQISATKCGFMPQLTWDDNILVQSNAITRFVAKEAGIAGKNNMEMAQCDAIVDFCSEMVAGKFKF